MQVAPIPQNVTIEMMDSYRAMVPEGQKNTLSFVCMGYLGMVRHTPMHADWVAHNSLYCNSVNKIADAIGQEAAQRLVRHIRADIKEKMGVSTEWC